MEKVNITTQVKVYKGTFELEESDQILIKTAVEQLDKAYAPYSNFHVGAALRLNSGEIFVGCNQENASYPLCMCGERVALYNAASIHPKTPVSCIAIVARNSEKPLDKPVSPCGACRQVISEFEDRFGQAIRILLKTDSDIVYELASAADILPLSFGASYLLK